MLKYKDYYVYLYNMVIDMELRYYNAKFDRYDSVKIEPYSDIEKAIMYYAIKLYGDDFYLLTQHNNELEYTLNGDISCIVYIGGD